MRESNSITEMHSYILPLLFAGFVTLLLAFVAWIRRSVTGARAFSLLMLAVAVWSFAYALELLAIDLEWVTFWASIQYFGILIVPLSWLIFTLQFSNQDHHLTRRNLLLLAIEPLIVLTLVWTNASHRLVWKEIALAPLGTATVTDYTYGSGFYVNAGYTYLLILIGSITLLRTCFRSSNHLYRGQVISLLVAVSVPWIGNIIYLTDMSPFPYLDLTPFALALTGVAVSWGLFRYRLLDLLPIARDTLVADMSDGLVVLDLANRIVDLNPAAERIFNRSLSEVHGGPLEPILPSGLAILNELRDDNETQSEIYLGEGGATRYFDLRLSSLKNKHDQMTGRLIVLRDVTDRVKAEKAAQLRAHRLALLNDITRASLENEKLNEMLQYLAERLGELINADGCFISLWDDKLQKVTPTAAFGAFREIYNHITLEPGELTMTESVITAGRTLTVHDFQNSPYISPRIASMFPAESLIGLPLIAGEQRFGSILIFFNDHHEFTGDEIDLGEQAAAQISLAIARTRLLESERRRADELEALRANVTDISGVREVPELLRAILERATGMLNATGGDIGLYDEYKQEITIIVSHNLGNDHAGMRMALGEGGMGIAIEKNSLIVIDDYTTWEGRSAQFHNDDWHAAMAVPLRIRERIVGALGILDTDPVRKFSIEDEQLLDLFAQQAAIAIENARLYAVEKHRAAELAVLFEASTAITKSINQSAVASITAEQLARTVNATSAHVLSCDLEEGIATVIAEYFSPYANDKERGSDLYAIYDLNEYPRTLEALRSGAQLSILIGDEEIDPKDRQEMKNYKVKSSLNVPMIASGRVLAYAEIWDSTSERSWDDEEIRICQTLANQAAVTLENARLYGEMQYMAITDPLTGMYNRRGLFEIGEREIQRSQRSTQPLTGIMLDIDHFKEINDTYSHAVGDQVLQGLALICKEEMRTSDILGRYGGEEFAILLPETDCQTAYKVAERLRKSIAGTPIQTKIGTIFITISMGTTCTSEGITDLAILLDRADTAMYAAKERGRNRVVPSATLETRSEAVKIPGKISTEIRFNS